MKKVEMNEQQDAKGQGNNWVSINQKSPVEDKMWGHIDLVCVGTKETDMCTNRSNVVVNGATRINMYECIKIQMVIVTLTKEISF